MDSRLETDDPAPLAVAFSGGGDSLALLLAAKTWADAHGRRLAAFTVDHRLRPEGADWALWCAERAGRLGVAHRTLVWEGAKPLTGRSAAARQARHRLLAEAAREAGAAVILMGHTADDGAEAALMRAAGSNTPSPRTWSPSPVWPQGRGIFLLRPLLEESRAGLRQALRERGETWIEDPANGDPQSARAQARARLIAGRKAPPALVGESTARAFRPALGEDLAGSLLLPREAWGRDQEAEGQRESLADLGAALLCAAGTDRPPRGDALRRLRDRIGAGEVFVATLAGARLESDGSMIRIFRDAGDRRRDWSDMDLPVGRAVVWDGRFELTGAVPGARVGALAGRAGRLPTPLRAATLEVPPAARPALPLVMLENGELALPTLLLSPLAQARSLVLSRFLAARRAIVNEAGVKAHGESRGRILNGRIEPGEACL